jgi:hypothetical protein
VQAKPQRQTCPPSYTHSHPAYLPHPCNRAVTSSTRHSPPAAGCRIHRVFAMGGLSFAARTTASRQPPPQRHSDSLLSQNLRISPLLSRNHLRPHQPTNQPNPEEQRQPESESHHPKPEEQRQPESEGHGFSRAITPRQRRFHSAEGRSAGEAATTDLPSSAQPLTSRLPTAPLQPHHSQPHSSLTPRRRVPHPSRLCDGWVIVRSANERLSSTPTNASF